jgi:hypothetical protein
LPPVEPARIHRRRELGKTLADEGHEMTAISVLIEALPDDRTRRIVIPEVMAAEMRTREALGRQRMD